MSRVKRANRSELTPAETYMVERRRKIACLLLSGENYKSIVDRLGTSTATIADVSHSLKQIGLL